MSRTPEGTHTAHTLAGAFALDALSEAERERFEEHLTGCDLCAQEVRGLQETAALLGVAAATRAPADLRDRVLAEVSRTRQVPPRVSRIPRPRGRIGPALLSLAAAACLVVAAALGVVAVKADHRADRLQARQDRVQARQDQINAVLSAPDARAVTAKVRSGGRGTVVYSRQGNRAVVLMAGLPAAPAARTYELWLMGEGAPRPAGTMTTATGPVMIDRVGRATQVGITVEPAAGSPAPTTRPIFATTLPV